MSRFRDIVFALVDEVESRVLGLLYAGGDVVRHLLVGSLIRIIDLTVGFAEDVIEEGFSLFRAGLEVVLGTPSDESLSPDSMEETD